jgi:hypothetical protein
VNRVGLIAFFAAATVCCGLAHPSPAEARGAERDITVVFQDVDIPADETVDGNVNVVFGNATIEGIVRGDCNAVFGTCTQSENGQIWGRSNSVSSDTARAFIPIGIIGSMADQDRHLIGNLASSAVVVLVFLLFPMRMRVALARVERHPAMSGFAGAAGTVAVFPLALLLTISVVGIPLILLEAAALFAGAWIGLGAIALLVGRRLCELVMPRSTPSPLVALILGLVVVSAAEIVPLVGWIVTALVWCVGLGAAMLSFVRSAQLDGATVRPSIGGPPMPGRSF